jgi:hypothetical protein
VAAIIKKNASRLPMGLERDDDGQLVKLSTRAYRGLSAEGIVRHALEEGVGVRQTMGVLEEMGFLDVSSADVTEARNIIRAELADEYAVSKSEAKALILRRSDKALARLFHNLSEGDLRAAKDITSLLTLQTKVYGLDKAEDSLEAKLREELSRVNDASRDNNGQVPRSTDRHAETIEAARDKFRQHVIDDEKEGDNGLG